MLDNKRISTPLSNETISKLRAGDFVLINGFIFTARDAAHKRLIHLIKRGQDLPMEIKGQIIYYVGPTPAKPGYPCGSAGPTTSYRMDPFTPSLLDAGLKGMIGKGLRSDKVIKSMKKNRAVYFAAVGGAAALISKSIKKSDIIAYQELGPEAIYKFYVKDLPVIVVIDAEGNNLYESEPLKYYMD